MKETEFDRYDRMKKLEKEAEVEKRKSNEFSNKIKSKKQKLVGSQKKQNWNQVYTLATANDEYDAYDEM